MKAGDLVGKPVIVREGGREVGRIKDLVVDQAGRRVIGFVVSEGLLKGTKVASWSALSAIGPDSVVFNSAGSVVKSADIPEIKAVLDAGTSIRGLKVQTTQGKELGKIDDFQFGEQSGEVEGYELTGGRFSDTMGGRSFLPLPESIELGKDIAFIAPEVESTIRQSSGGLKGAFHRGES